MVSVAEIAEGIEMKNVSYEMEMPSNFVEMNDREIELTGGITEGGKIGAYVGAGIFGASLIAGMICYARAPGGAGAGICAFTAGIGGAISIVSLMVGASEDRKNN